MQNTFKTMLLMAALTALLVMAGYTMGGASGALVMLLVALAMNFATYWFSDSAVIRATRARPLTREENPEFYEMVDRLAKNAGIPTPNLYTMDDPRPNAFATGRDPKHGAVVVSRGLLSHLKREELEGVIAHEMAHIQNRDILTSTIAASLGGAVTSLARIAGYNARRSRRGGAGGGAGDILMMMLAPLAAMLIQLGVSRSREYAADEEGARFTGKPLALASALESIAEANERDPGRVDPALAHMFTVSPLSGGIGGLFSTHPPTEERVRRLQELATRMGQTA